MSSDNLVSVPVSRLARTQENLEVRHTTHSAVGARDWPRLALIAPKAPPSLRAGWIRLIQSSTQRRRKTLTPARRRIILSKSIPSASLREMGLNLFGEAGRGKEQLLIGNLRSQQTKRGYYPSVFRITGLMVVLCSQVTLPSGLKGKITLLTSGFVFESEYPQP